MISDRQLAQLICAWRLFSPTLDLSLSTRESATFRNGAVRLGITQMSAESRTQPGGYAEGDKEELEQFAIHDDRPVGKWPPPCGRQGCSRCSRIGNPSWADRGGHAPFAGGARYNDWAPFGHTPCWWRPLAPSLRGEGWGGSLCGISLPS